MRFGSPPISRSVRRSSSDTAKMTSNLPSACLLVALHPLRLARGQRLARPRLELGLALPELVLGVVLVQDAQAVVGVRDVLRHQPAVDEDDVRRPLPHAVRRQLSHLAAAVALDAQRHAGEVAADEREGAAAAVERHGADLAELLGPGVLGRRQSGTLEAEEAHVVLLAQVVEHAQRLDRAAAVGRVRELRSEEEDAQPCRRLGGTAATRWACGGFSAPLSC